MDIYLCSTVRNLLFALLSSLSKDLRTTYIILVTDQQDIDVENFDLNSLPEHIKLIFIKRADINKQLGQTIKGKLLKTISMFNIVTTSWLRTYFSTILFKHLVHINLPINTLLASNLYLFNDRNKFARLLRLGFKDYSVIEDGLSNYRGVKFKLFEKFLHALMFNKQPKRYLGDNKRCKNIYLLNIIKAPVYIKHKVIKIDFISSELINKYCIDFFKAHEISQTSQYILATQPISIVNFSKLNYDLIVYEKILEYLKNKNIDCVMKIHPREKKQRFIDNFPETQLIESKIPLELMLFNNKNKSQIISIYSTAGMGFEEFCHRITLIEDDEAHNINAILASWKDDSTIIDRHIERQLSHVK